MENIFIKRYENSRAIQMRATNEKAARTKNFVRMHILCKQK